ncbi:isochorismatase family protein [Streptomyces erythrochromogenes]|uniref:isochorismatase family protein n=1 Tax=Streptomyces erythrochromogenes TaxID=285574 RepID=UPI0036B49A1E
MALPRIDAYPLPTEADLPANRVEWKPDPARSVLLVHDLQNHFLSAYGEGSPTVAALLRQVARLIAEAERAGVPVLWTAQRGGQSAEERGLQQDFWGPGLPADPIAEAIPEAVAPASPDSVLTKWKYSAFVRTDLAGRMAALGRDQLVITGVYAHIGVLLTAADAWMRDIQAFLVADAVADFSAEEHRMALRYAAGRCAHVTTADRVATAW